MNEVPATLERQPQVDVSSRVKVRKLNDFPDIQPAYRNIARNYATPLLTGPPLCDELMALILHLYTEEEAQLSQHVTSPVGICAREIAGREKLPVDRVLLVLDRVIKEKGILIGIGTGLCAVKCGSRHVIEMEALPGYQRPPRLFTTTLLRNAPNYVINAVNTWKKYIRQVPG